MLLTTPLRFTYGIEDENDPDWVHLDYLLLERDPNRDLGREGPSTCGASRAASTAGGRA
jgi:hypothetical protein